MGKLLKWSGIAVAVIAVAIGIAGFVVPMFRPWTRLNCTQIDIDITTGRIRTEKYFLYMRFRSEVKDSALTEQLPPEILADAAPQWRRAATLSPGQHSPNCTFGEAIGEINQLRVLWEAGEFPEEARRKTALNVIALWRKGRSAAPAGRYINRLYDLTDRAGNIDLLKEIDARMPDSYATP